AVTESLLKILDSNKASHHPSERINDLQNIQMAADGLVIVGPRYSGSGGQVAGVMNRLCYRRATSFSLLFFFSSFAP
ncbi:hypothetical protein ACJX0J_024611, partial [Zea mays]